TREAARVPAAWAQTQWVARRAGLPPSWLWAVKRDRWLRRQLGAADVVVSMDEATDGVLRLVPDLLDGATVLEYADRAGHQEALEHAERCACLGLMERVVTAELPGILVQVDEVADVGRRLAPVLGQRPWADAILNVLGLLDWAAIPDQGNSGVLAQQAIAGLW